MSGVPFHFLLLGIGEVLKTENIIDPLKLQEFIAKEDAFGGIRVPLSECRIALNLMRDSDFIASTGDFEYVWKNHPFITGGEILPAYGELFTLQDFKINCDEGNLVDYDGEGYYSDGRVYWKSEPAIPSAIASGKVKNNINFRYVIWFNK